MKKNIRFRFQVLVFILLFSVLCPLTSVRATTNVYLNFTAAQINTNIARVASSYPNWDTAYSWGSHTGLYATVSAWNATNAAQHVINTNLAAQIAAMAGLASNSTFVAFTNAQHTINTNTSALISNLQSAVTNLQSNAVTSIVFNGTTNTPLNGAVNLGTVSGGQGGPVVTLGTNEVIVAFDGGPSVIDGVYVCTNGLSGTNAVYNYGLYSLFVVDGTWMIYYGSNENPLAMSLLPSSDPITSIWWNIDFDLNLTVTSNSENSLIVSGADITAVNGMYTCTNGLSGTNAVYTSDAGYDVWHDVDNSWNISPSADHSTYHYWIYPNDVASEPWQDIAWFLEATETGSQTNSPVYPYTLDLREVRSSLVEIDAAINSCVQFVRAPTGSVAAGSSGQYSISADTNQYFYWYSPTAVSAETTGVWLRVLGETF